MGVVGSLPSPPPPPSTVNDTTKILYEKSIPSCDECEYYIITMDNMDSSSNFSSNSNLSSNSNIDNQNKSNSRKNSRRKSPIQITYGPTCVKLRSGAAPTLATGRRSKFMKLEGDAAVKREIRRQRNREAAKKLKEKRTILEQQLRNDILELESKEQELLSKIQSLKTRKQQLELQYQHIVTIQEKFAQTASSTFKHIQSNHLRLHHSVPICQNNINIKEESNPPSPQWQLLFSI
jgi:hypothetical protein